jgi:hypothetical protein
MLSIEKTQRNAMEKKDARKIVNKMIEIAGLGSQKELAEIFGGISSQSISGAIAKGKLPDRWYEIIEEKYGVKREVLEKSVLGTKGFVEGAGDYVVGDAELGNRDKRMAVKDEKYEILLLKFQSVFDFLLDTYQGDAFAVDNFLEKMRNDFLKKDQDYLRWQYAKQLEISERLKKQSGEDYKAGFVEKKSVNG